MADAPAPRPTLCIGVLTLNEARRIRQCLESASFADRVVVLDSGSTDSTREIAQKMGTEVHQSLDWQGFAVQRNRLLTFCKEDYVFFLDADEVITPGLRAEIQAALTAATPTVWETYWREVAFGRPIFNLFGKKSLARLFPRSVLLHFEGVVHEHALLKDPDIPRRVFQSPLLHYSRETVHDSLRKLTQYSMLGAAKRASKGKYGGVMRGIASGLAMFVRLYIFRASFLSGGPGFLYAFFIALECFFRYAALHYDRQTLTESVQR
ncbi:glycosyltransferase family 2 protein [Aquabacterium sp. A08]|uniref:glycosyltransferase family 2 protein n=1 Tax=Aquabacterium sp. A08 TaxID=2718532 RepID=UPI00141F2C3E|nr:glycosyltransferase family 2 protein [Aquabacterium sp. A08]NIC41952.1 glycosyltransferase family 2 protein [Aquabacterium sp. A08]